MEHSGLRRKDTTKGPPLRILCLDGGGVRGYSMLILLQELMHRTFVEVGGRAPKRHEILKPCDHFDLIAGTGTGGLIALMLGRLRLDLETCKDLYIRMTRRVFETDKTFAGVPYRSTLFKASKLEEVMRECIREHTVAEAEGNDDDEAALESTYSLQSPRSPQRSGSVSSRYSQIGVTPVSSRNPMYSYRRGNPNAYLYDARENRTKTAITAVYKGTPKSGSPVLLRSYDSRKEPAPEFNCTIWQAGRATCATGIAFKPIQIGQSVFVDEGAGKFNPSPQILDEAVCNEWPGRDVGVFVSIGTGKRPKGTGNQQHLWWEDFVSSGISDFAEARRRLAAKIEGCEDTHQSMLKDHLSKRHVNVENYYRLNVEVGVGEFGMNEWNRLAEISTNTRMYLAKPDVQDINMDASIKLGKIHRSKMRWERAMRGDGVHDRKPGLGLDDSSFTDGALNVPDVVAPPLDPLAVELPAADVTTPPPRRTAPSARRSSTDEKIVALPSDARQHLEPSHNAQQSNGSSRPNSSQHKPVPPPRPSGEHARPRTSFDQAALDSSGGVSAVTTSNNSPRRSEDVDRPGHGHSHGHGHHVHPPPLPPKTPLSSASRPGGVLPYPDTDGPPPTVNVARKPEYRGR